MSNELRRCLRDPIPELFEAARLLDEAVSAHLGGDFKKAAALIKQTNTQEIRDWTESLWGASSPYVKVRQIQDAAPHLPKDQRIKVRMPNTAEKKLIHERDGYHCRFCGVPLIRMEIRKKIMAVYPHALPWGSTNASQHAAFQALWLQYDHLLPHARGGNNDLDNVILTCAPCNYGRWHYTVEEVGLSDPRTRHPVLSDWDGLERFK
jgi:5-methylcytosine-specific restriction endonuclease McrA